MITPFGWVDDIEESIEEHPWVHDHNRVAGCWNAQDQPITGLQLVVGLLMDRVGENHHQPTRQRKVGIAAGPDNADVGGIEGLLDLALVDTQRKKVNIELG